MGWGLRVSGFTLDYAQTKCLGLGQLWGCCGVYCNMGQGQSCVDTAPCHFSLVWVTSTRTRNLLAVSQVPLLLSLEQLSSAGTLSGE